MTLTGSPDLIKRIYSAKSLRLFLDYDGTLAEFASTPDTINPDPNLIELVNRLVEHPRIQPAVISGRRLSHIVSLLPVPGILLAGTYGIELRTPDGKLLHRLDYARIRPGLEMLKPHWGALIHARDGFYLEDKDWALAIHARFASDLSAGEVLSAARETASQIIDKNVYRLKGGEKFLEVGPVLANKGAAVNYILEREPLGDAVLVYAGDDDKDEEAFEVVNQRDGIAILVSQSDRETHAALKLRDPSGVREWLKSLLAVPLN